MCVGNLGWAGAGAGLGWNNPPGFRQHVKIIQKLFTWMTPLTQEEDDMAAGNLNAWLVCVCFVDFDLELGPTMVFMYPQGRLSRREAKNVCNLAFPDSHVMRLGDMISCFRFRQNYGKGSELSDEESDGDCKDGCGEEVYRRPIHLQEPFFGYVHFRQVRDETNARGFFQKAIIIVTHLPYVDLFGKLVQAIGEVYYQYGPPIVEAACLNISQWPMPEPGKYMELPFIGQVFAQRLPLQDQLPATKMKPENVDTKQPKSNLSQPGIAAGSADSLVSTTPTQTTGTIPVASHCTKEDVPERDSNSLNASSTTSRSESPILLYSPTPPQSPVLPSIPSVPIIANQLSSRGSLDYSTGCFQCINLYTAFRHQLHNLWFFWELVITGEPILVVAKDPAWCSQLVLGLVSLIFPLAYGGDYRPYFTLYDPDAKVYNSLHDRDPLSLPTVILGINNTFFLKTMSSFPHILCFGEDPCAYENDKRLPEGSQRRPRTKMKIHSNFCNDPMKATSQPSCTVSKVPGNRFGSALSPFLSINSLSQTACEYFTLICHDKTHVIRTRKRSWSQTLMYYNNCIAVRKLQKRMPRIGVPSLCSTTSGTLASLKTQRIPHPPVQF